MRHLKKDGASLSTSKSFTSLFSLLLQIELEKSLHLTTYLSIESSITHLYNSRYSTSWVINYVTLCAAIDYMLFISFPIMCIRLLFSFWVWFILGYLSVLVQMKTVLWSIISCQRRKRLVFRYNFHSINFFFWHLVRYYCSS